MTKKALLWLVVFGAIGFGLTCSPRGLIKDFDVEFQSKHSSSGGDRMLDVIYTVKDGKIVSCRGTYSYPPSANQQMAGIFKNNVDPIDLRRLKNKDYNAPIVLITAVEKGQKLRDEVDNGNSSYKYRIALK